MSAIAHYLLDMNIAVTGSDIRSGEVTRGLLEEGCTVFATHEASNISGVGRVVVSDAISPDNPEIMQALKLGIAVTKRARFLQELGVGKSVIHVAGTHGKTTTAAMIATVLMDAGVDPGFILGAGVNGLGGKRARASSGRLLVAEACEAFRNLSHYTPDFALITNIEDDHLEHYGNQAGLDDAFVSFINRAGQAGTVLVNGDDVGVKRLWSSITPGVISFGFSSTNDISVSELVLHGQGSGFSVLDQGRKLGRVELTLPGRHMAENALACIAICLRLGIAFEVIAEALTGFKGVSRRWNERGTFGGVSIVEDFAHHPTELRVNLEAARLPGEEGRRIALVFQPQLYSRTRRLSQAYADVISNFDAAFLLEIDGGGENSSAGVSSQVIIDQLDTPEHSISLYHSAQDLADSLLVWLKAGDMVLVTGGSDIPALTDLLETQLAEPQGHVDCRRLLDGEVRNATVTTDLEQTDNALSLLEKNFQTIPASVAVSCGPTYLTYSELDLVTSHLCQVFGDLGLKRGSVVALGLPPSVDYLACQVAILRAGCTCLSLDERLPEKRLSFMLEVSAADLLVTASGSRIDKAILQVEKCYLSDLIQSHETRANQFGDIDRAITATAHDGDTAFICFTSGSTGQPKGIPISHASLSAFLPAAIECFLLNGKSRTVLNTSLAFDASIAEIMLTLSAGGEIHIPGVRRPLLGRELHQFIDSNCISHLFATPSVLLTLPGAALESLRVIVSGGEVCPQSLANDLSVHAQVINGYGPTEATIYTTACHHRADRDICIGTPLAHVDVCILDSDRQMVPTGDIGEICIGGVGVCREYLVDGVGYPDKFISIQAGNSKAVPLYRTGDLGRFRADGQLEYIGRLDNQVKIRGNRIELEEIDAALLKLDGVIDAVACEESSKITAYYTTDSDAPFPSMDFAKSLSTWLPEFMLPGAYMKVDAISLTGTGKKDRKETAHRNRHRMRPETSFIAPVGDTQVRLATLWQKTLGIDEPIGQAHEFRLMGGDSLQYMLLIMDIEDEFSIDIPAGFFGQVDSLKHLACQIDELLVGAPPARPEADDGFLQSTIYKQQRTFINDWKGRRHDAHSLLVTSGNKNAIHHLFWCLQSGQELDCLARELGENYCVHGMRSGHLVMEYTDENLADLSRYYAGEIGRIYPSGPVCLGGNCQGGQVSHAVARLLEEQGRNVQLLILMEQARFPAYEGKLAFIYGSESFLNPHTRYDDGLGRFDRAYPQGYSLDFIPGDHGRYFQKPGAFYLASSIKSAVENTTSGNMDDG